MYLYTEGLSTPCVEVYNIVCLLLLFQVSLYAKEKFKVTSFMAQNLIGFKECYIISEFNKPVEDLYKFSDVYRQIEHVVETVSEFLSKYMMQK